MKTSTVLSCLFFFAVTVLPGAAFAGHIKTPTAATPYFDVSQPIAESKGDYGITANTDAGTHSEIHNLIIGGLQRVTDLALRLNWTPVRPIYDPETNKLME